MKLVTFEFQGKTAIGVLNAETGSIVNLTAAEPNNPAFRSMLDLIESGAAGSVRARQLDIETPVIARIALADVRLLAPIPVPPQIRDCSVFEGHIKRAPAGMAKIAMRRTGDLEGLAKVKPLDDIPQVYKDRPIYYFTNRFSVAGPNDVVVWPAYSSIMDFELECAIVIGRKGRDLSSEDALSHVFGYMIYNDFSARDMQNLEMAGMLGPTKGKSFDGGNVMGPWLVTADEVADPQALEMSVAVNGTTWATGSTKEMVHGFADILAYITQHETIYPGEVIGSGTMGYGCGLEVDRFLNDGDEVTLKVAGLGELTNRVVIAKS
ncbi:fumarylacetoacetate hydrolase family protein [Rhizobium sp. C4]|uniref:fumarylacetoacetate hydrolase family protein n=1 Tax=Rhizobium sp. C4 TaxID=1349800 RepID=UPI001E320173|nr:fumarylacetoacetate hydrolase family protein [Rhizobium sp. C4]MCD2172313.1 fumarylacetoacetate hydrolase family protein [Rhizobium sp. C4]